MAGIARATLIAVVRLIKNAEKREFLISHHGNTIISFYSNNSAMFHHSKTQSLRG